MKRVEENNSNPSPEDIKKNCIFCKIISKDIPSKIIETEKEFIATLDVNPASEGHTLIVPTQHLPVFPMLGPEIIGKLGVFVKKTSQKILQNLGAKGTTILIPSGTAAGQQSPHAIAHIIPRYEADDVGIKPEPTQNPEQKEFLTKISQGLGLTIEKEEILVQDDDLTAVVPNQAVATGEIQIIPNAEYTILEQIPEELLQKMFQISMKLKSTLFDILQPTGTTLLIQNGVPSGQTEKKFKIRIIPRYENDNLDLNIKNKQTDPAKINEIYTKFQNTIEYESSENKQNQTHETTNQQKETELDTDEDYLIKALKRNV